MARGEGDFKKREWDGELTTISGLSKDRKELIKEVEKQNGFPSLEFWFVSELCTLACTWGGGGGLFLQFYSTEMSPLSPPPPPPPEL
jgi:hypothetical protein